MFSFEKVHHPSYASLLFTQGIGWSAMCLLVLCAGPIGLTKSLAWPSPQHVAVVRHSAAASCCALDSRHRPQCLSRGCMCSGMRRPA